MKESDPLKVSTLSSRPLYKNRVSNYSNHLQYSTYAKYIENTLNSVSKNIFEWVLHFNGNFFEISN